MSHGREVVGKWNLLGSGQDSYASQTSQSPNTSRRIKSWIPELDGALHREAAQPFFINQALSGPVVSLYNFNQADSSGLIQRFYFAAARTSSAATTCNLYTRSGGVWVAVGAIGTLADAPMFRAFGNLLFMDDGVTSWMFDGTAWVRTGIGIPFQSGFTAAQKFLGPPFWQPAINVLSGSGPATFPGTVVLNGWGANGHVGDYEGGVNQGHSHPPVLDPGSTNSYTGASNAIDGNPATKAESSLQHTHQYGGCVWGFTNPSMLVTGTVTLTIDSEIPANGSGGLVTTNRSASIWYSTDSGASWNLVYDVGGFAGRPRQTDTVTISITDPTKIQVMAFNDAHDDMTHWVWGISLTGAGGSGSFSALVGRYYWFTNTDQAPTRPVHESDSSAISENTGVLTAGQVVVYQTAGLWSVNAGSRLISVSASADNPGPTLPLNAISPDTGVGADILAGAFTGLTLYINGTLIGVVSGAEVSGGSRALMLVSNSVATVFNGRAVLVPSRCTHWNTYASESDGSKVGMRLGDSIPVTQNLSITPVVDESPFIDDSTNLFTPVFRPVRNDPPPPSKILETHKSRLWRVRTQKPNLFSYTANEEVNAGNNGNPSECVPGGTQAWNATTPTTATQSVINTISDIVNESSFPDQSNRIRGLISHADALYMFSERQCFPLYGESIDDFAISQVTAFSCGLAGRFAAKSTPFGMPFISYDRKALLYPSSGTPGVNVTAGLIEIGRPMRNVFQQISVNHLDEIVTEFYYFGKRTWWVVCFLGSDGNYQTWAYDFTFGGWFQLQRGFSSLCVFEMGDGNLVLVGGSSDGNVYVIDDQSGNFTSFADLPQATFRPALIDFGDPDAMHIPQFLELEFSSNVLANDITVMFWLDPEDADNPGTGRTATLQRIKGSNRYRAWFQGGMLCHRLLVEIVAAGSQNGGTLRGVKLVAQKVKGLIGNPEGLTGDTVSAAGYILLETGDKIVLEDGSGDIILEG